MPRGTTAGTDTSPAWIDVNYLTGVASNDCGKCHGYPPMAISAHTGNTAPTTCINCHNHVNAAGTGFTDVAKHIDGILQAGGDNCTDCHTNTNLSATHLKHTNPSTVLSGKKLSAGDYGNPAWWYSYSNTGGVPLAACGYCHPNTQSTHMNQVKNLNLDPNEPGLPAGTLKGKNGSPVVITQNPGVSVICSSVYCHSDGYSPSGGGPTARDYGYKPSPDWYGGSYSAGACNGCHGNSPTGSSAHGKHAVGIHYKTIYNLQNGGLAAAGNTPTGSHGNAATSTSINCNLCHNSTVTVSYNAKNSICMNCHTDTNTPATGNASISISGTSTVHVNGVPDVTFAAVNIRSKAQVRDDITVVTELTENWTRVNGYKVSGSHDESVSALNTSSYTGGSCTVSCHNGFPVQWTSTVTCTSCHTALPQ